MLVARLYIAGKHSLQSETALAYKSLNHTQLADFAQRMKAYLVQQQGYSSIASPSEASQVISHAVPILWLTQAKIDSHQHIQGSRDDK